MGRSSLDRRFGFWNVPFSTFGFWIVRKLTVGCKI